MAIAAALLSLASMQAQTDDNMATFRTWAQTPPMGWNSWDCYYSSVTEKEVMQNAQYRLGNNKPVDTSIHDINITPSNTPSNTPNTPSHRTPNIASYSINGTSIHSINGQSASPSSLCVHIQNNKKVLMR